LYFHAEAAKAKAYSVCKFDGKLGQEEIEGLDDFVTSMVLMLVIN
jgi:hypothetical protein